MYKNTSNNTQWRLSNNPKAGVFKVINTIGGRKSLEAFYVKGRQSLVSGELEINKEVGIGGH